jgi:hypothetical protein
VQDGTGSGLSEPDLLRPGQQGPGVE